jgi:integrase
MPRGAAVIKYVGSRGVVWRVKFVDADGKQVQETLGPESQGWTRKKAEAERKSYRHPGPLTFRDYGTTWFAEGPARRGWKPSTVVQYRSTKRRLLEHFGPMPLAAIRPRHVAEYIADTSAHGLGAATVGPDVSVLQAIFTTARREELVDANPAERAERPRLPRRSWRILEPAEVGRVAKAFEDEQARAIFLTLILTGIRRSEIRRLRWRDVDLLAAVLRIRESKSEEGVRSIALAPMLAAELSAQYQRSAYTADEDFVFCHPERGTAYRAETFKEQLEAALQAAGIEGRVRAFHHLRHASLTNGAAAGENAVALMARAGHRSMKTTQTYLHLAGVVFRDEAERWNAPAFVDT